jgi:hypothetical protein
MIYTSPRDKARRAGPRVNRHAPHARGATLNTNVEAGAQPGILFEMGEPLVIESYRQGRSATRAEIAAAIARERPQQLLRLWPS